MKNIQYLSQGHELGGGVTGSSVSNGSVGDGELTEVVTDHLGSDVEGVENLTVVDTNDGTDHLRDDDHVSEVGLDDGGLLVGDSSGSGGSQLLDETHGLRVETSRELSSDSSGAQLGEILSGHFEQVLKVNTLVGKGLEDSLFSVSYTC